MIVYTRMLQMGGGWGITKNSESNTSGTTRSILMIITVLSAEYLQVFITLTFLVFDVSLVLVLQNTIQIEKRQVKSLLFSPI
jgi:hypothetical protein